MDSFSAGAVDDNITETPEVEVSTSFVVSFQNNKGSEVNLQEAFLKYKNKRQRDVKKGRKRISVKNEARLRAMANPTRMWNLRMKFVETLKKYFGVPYAKRYWTSEEKEYFSPIFLDCCGLVRRAMRDLRKDFGFKLGPWNQGYMYDTLPNTIENEEDVQPGDLVFIQAKYFNPNMKKQKHDITHVEIWLGDGPKTIGSRWHRGHVQVFDSYQFVSTSYNIDRYIFKSIDTWLMGICRSRCVEHAWKTRTENFKPGKKSVFSSKSEKKTGQTEPEESCPPTASTQSVPRTPRCIGVDLGAESDEDGPDDNASDSSDIESDSGATTSDTASVTTVNSGATNATSDTASVTTITSGATTSSAASTSTVASTTPTSGTSGASVTASASSSGSTSRESGDSGAVDDDVSSSGTDLSRSSSTVSELSVGSSNRGGRKAVNQSKNAYRDFSKESRNPREEKETYSQQSLSQKQNLTSKRYVLSYNKGNRLNSPYTTSSDSGIESKSDFLFPENKADIVYNEVLQQWKADYDSQSEDECASTGSITDNDQLENSPIISSSKDKTAKEDLVEGAKPSILPETITQQEEAGSNTNFDKAPEGPTTTLQENSNDVNSEDKLHNDETDVEDSLAKVSI